VAERWFLKIDGIDGESTDVSHKGEIDVASWSWGVSQSGTSGGGGGGGAGKASFQDFHFVMQMSKATPKLLQACASGMHIKEALLSGVRGAGKVKNASFLKVKLTDVIISGLQLAESPEAVPAEQVSFSYGKIELTYTLTSSKGTAGTSEKFSWDLKQSKKF
jgi:type VI secretion system secreted protein Hcp